jgi:3-oxoacyl-[acyl-carrier protein] reductase
MGARLSSTNYRQNEDAARATLARVRESGSDGMIAQADVSRPDELGSLLESVRSEYGKLDIS